MIFFLEIELNLYTKSINKFISTILISITLFNWFYANKSRFFFW